MSEHKPTVPPPAPPTEAPAEPPVTSVPQDEERGGWPLFTLLLLGLLGLALCAGGGWWCMHWMMDPEGERWVRQFQGNPTFMQQIGVVSSTRYDLRGTFGETHEETMVFFVEGNNGSGQLVVTEFGMKVPQIELRTASGNTVLQEGVAGPPPAEHE
jgi:hypothetical protein